MAKLKIPTTMDFDFLAAVVYGLTGQTGRPPIIEWLETCPIINWQTRNPFPDLSPILFWFEAILAGLLGLESITDTPLPTDLPQQLEGMTEAQASEALRDYFITVMAIRLDIAKILLTSNKR